MWPNDYAPDFILRNDSGKNEKDRFFREVSRELAGSSMNGFGMGVTLQDYDNDGRQDLFLTYMVQQGRKQDHRNVPRLGRTNVCRSPG